MEDKLISIYLTEENAKHIEDFLQGFMPTHKFPPPSGSLQMKALNDLYKTLRAALDAADSK